ncbi:helix-turn-helix transcriptional regulator [Streptomyces sp. NPDC006632]|uniref:helix-turn-helix transcriptional regulator n=1 Tax=Streptomyces sp. NPDC006632 TaxID=3157182 RepID=UPI0033AC1450
MRPGAEVWRLRGWLVTEMRRDRNIPQQELADEVGCSRSAVSTWETRNQRPAPKFLIRLADYFEVAPLDLLEGPGSEPTLRQLRLGCGLTQTEVAQALSVSASTYCDVETGRQALPDRWVPILQSVFNTNERTVRNCAPRRRPK